MGRLHALALLRFAVLDVDRERSIRPVGQGDHEAGVEAAEAVGVARVEASGRVRELHSGDATGSLGPPGVNGPISSVEIGGEVAEQVDRQRFRREQVGPEALVIEVLVRLDERRTVPGGRHGLRGEEAGAALAGETKVEVAADQARRRTRSGPMGSDRVPVGLAPSRVVVADRATELGHLRPASDPVVVQPAMSGLEFLL